MGLIDAIAMIIVLAVIAVSWCVCMVVEISREMDRIRRMFADLMEETRQINAVLDNAERRERQ